MGKRGRYDRPAVRGEAAVLSFERCMGEWLVRAAVGFERVWLQLCRCIIINDHPL